MAKNEQGFAPILIIGIVTAVLAGGTGTVIFSDSSKPGDPLYGLDRATENVQVALSLTDNSKKEVHAAIALERLGELKALYAESQPDADSIAEAHDDYEEHKAILSEMSDDDGSLDEREQEPKRSYRTREGGRR